MMKLRQVLASALATTIAVTCFSIPTVAESTVFATPQALIEDVLEVSCEAVTSGTLTDAINTVKSGITISGDQVLYNGAPLGYWYADSSNTLWRDETKSSALIQGAVDGYDILPTVLYTLLSDVNNQLIENYVPTSDDWSKIVGKYDITLGDVTIPADQWISVDVATTHDILTNGSSINISKLSGLTADMLGNAFADNNVYMFAYLVDDTGALYIQNFLAQFYASGSSCNAYVYDVNETGTVNRHWVTTADNEGYSACSTSDMPQIRAGLFSTGENKVSIRVGYSNASASQYRYLGRSADVAGCELLNIDDSAIKNTCNIANAKAYGIAYFTGAQIAAATVSGTVAEFNNFFVSNMCNKKVVGNIGLTKRLAKLSTLTNSDTITVTADSWLVNGRIDLDSYIASQEITLAGMPAVMSSDVEVEPLSFKVVLPTNLPLYMDTNGTVTAASNASILNKSNAAVKITDIEITAKPDCDWVLVSDNPSDKRDAGEFTFSTSLTAGTVLAKGEELPFTYIADLSPVSVGVDSIDLATVTVTIDWEDTD